MAPLWEEDAADVAVVTSVVVWWRWWRRPRLSERCRDFECECSDVMPRGRELLRLGMRDAEPVWRSDEGAVVASGSPFGWRATMAPLRVDADDDDGAAAALWLLPRA